MKIDLSTLSLAFGIIHLSLAIILGILYQKDKLFRGFGGLIIGISLLGLSFLVIFAGKLIDFANLIQVAYNALLFAGLLSIYTGVLRFYHRQPQVKILSIFSIFYAILILFASTFGIDVIPRAVTAFSVALFSALTSQLIHAHQAQEDRPFSLLLRLTFFLNALYFLVKAVLLVFSTTLIPIGLITNVEIASYFVLTFNTVFWAFGFTILMNQQLAEDTADGRKFYNLIFETIPEAVLLTRLSDGQIFRVNEGFTRLTGYGEDEVSEKSTLEIGLWCDPKQRENFTTLLTKTGSVKNMEVEFRRKDNKLLTSVVSARTIMKDREPHILNVVRDITSYKKMAEKLRENEEKYRFLTENSSDVIWHINKSYRVDYISPADEVIRGFKREEMIGEPVWGIFKPEGVKLVRAKIDHHREFEEVGNNMNTTRFEIEQRCKDGSWVWTEVTAAPHYDKYNNLIGYHGISRDISARKILLEKLHQQATIDELTQVLNRRQFMTLAEQELKRAKRYHHPLTLVVADFDNLKQINDTYGHLAGDRALSVFAKIVKTLIRDVDIIGRFGGDEFLILFPETDEHDAQIVIERINQVLSTSPVVYQKEQFNISVSSGISSFSEWTDTLEDILKRADAALYEAKGYEDTRLPDQAR